MINLGGNLLQTIQLPVQSDIEFASTPYLYKYIKLNKNQIINLDYLKSACIFLLAGSITADTYKLVEYGDTLQLENKMVNLIGLAELNYILLVGSPQIFDLKPESSFFRLERLKRVEKPWGYEIWITGEHPGYCLKKIFIKNGTKTSLQYHQIKRETNVLFEGTARLYFKAQQNVLNNQVTARDLAYCEMSPMSTIDIYPQTLHRLEAITDITLYEVSTPHLDDVIRVSDDTNRLSGRIQSEHGNNET